MYSVIIPILKDIRINKKELIEMVSLDFERDINQLEFHKKLAIEKIKRCDTLIMLLDSNKATVDQDKYYRLIKQIQWWWFFNSNNKSRTEADSKGYLSSVQNTDLAYSILKYNFYNTDYKSVEDEEMKEMDMIRAQMPNITDHKIYDKYWQTSYNLPVSNILIGAFACIIAIQLFYYLFFFLRLAIYKKPKKAVHVEHPISVVICARDEAHNLANNLPGVLVQKYSTTHEVVLVNDNSEDETKYLLEEFKKSFKNLNPVLLSQEAKMINGKKFPLSIGIKSAKNETLLLTDADCIPASEHWMQLMQDGYDDGIEIVLGYGAYRKKPGIY